LDSAAGVYWVNVVRDADGTRLMAGARAGHSFSSSGTEAAKNERKNDRPLRRPGYWFGSQRALESIGSRGCVPPMRLHRDDPLIDYSDGRVCADLSN
jgi:hypothetical protein